MKNRWKHIFIPVLAMALCLSLAACGSGDVTGADWRTTGVVVGSGTITHDGESVDVLVTDYGIAVNPLRPDLIKCLDDAGIPHVQRDVGDIFYGSIVEEETELRLPADVVHHLL